MAFHSPSRPLVIDSAIDESNHDWMLYEDMYLKNLCGSHRCACCISPPVINEPIDSLLSQLPSVLMVIVVISPAEHHQAFRLGVPNVGQVL